MALSDRTLNDVCFQAIAEDQSLLRAVVEQAREANRLRGQQGERIKVQTDLEAEANLLREENEALKCHTAEAFSKGEVSVLGRTLDEWYALEQELALRDINDHKTVDGIVRMAQASAQDENATLRASRDKLEDALRDAMRAVAKLEARAALADEMYAWLCGPGQKDEWTNQQRHFVMRYTATKETT